MLFSLLENCTDLETSKRIFYYSVLFAKRALQAFISGRPSNLTDISSIIEEIIDINDENDDQTDDNDDSNGTESDDWFLNSQAKTIKAASPFTWMFTDVFVKLELETIKGSGKFLNLLFNEDFIIFLQYHFMYYVFIWSGFVYRPMHGSKITRLSQGVIEKHFGTMRRELPKPIVPSP